MFNKEGAIELWHCIKVHEAVKKIGKILDKYEAEDYLLFIRTENNTFIHGAIVYSDIETQLAHLIEIAAEELNTRPTDLIKEIEAKIYRHNNLMARLNDIQERQQSLSHEELVDEIKQAFKESECTDKQIAYILKKCGIKI